MNRRLNYLFAVLFLFSSLHASAGICDDMASGTGSDVSLSDSMQDCHSDKAPEINVDDKPDHQQCCDKGCVTCFGINKLPVSSILVSRFAEPVNTTSFDLLTTFKKILTPPPII